MGNKIVINDGFKTYDIENQHGKLLGQFSFNPSDTNIVHRHAEVISALEKINFPEVSGEDLEKVLAEVEPLIYEKINYLFGADVAKDFFNIMGPFSPTDNGQFFVESVIDAIGQAIQKETGKRVEKMKNKIRKHTSKYYG